jgi:1-deoxy-D-xylulose-5-phosphate synthase
LKILNNIESPLDVKALPPEKLSDLCTEIREFLVQEVSKTGGHLASNLGVVELTVAIHRVFDTSKDQLLFDVGHQCYTHKLLTGRKSEFHTLRQFGGLSGYPKPSESVHDAFIAGHSSTSISNALGIARAKTLSGGDYDIIALIGDGALTGGLAYEAMCDVGEAGEPLIILLNDNGMSINGNVGGMARYLSRRRMKPSYMAFKRRFKRITDRIPGGKAIYRFVHKVKTLLKGAMLHSSMFEEMGLQYSGPIDGHDIPRIVDALEWGKRLNQPVVIHVVTQKGKGYKYSEQFPEEYHGVNPFDYESGISDEKENSFSSVFGEQLEKLASQNPGICAITASMTGGTGLSDFAARFPNRFFDVGIAEGHAVAMAAGMASRGITPIFAVYSSFLQRSYDMLLHDTAICKQHVVLAVDRAGLVPGDGETHQGLFDVAFLSSIPGMTIFSPSSFEELRDVLRYAVEKVEGPVAVRYPKGGEGEYRDGGCEKVKLLRDGEDFTLVTYGVSVNTALSAAEILARDGISVEIIKLTCIHPIDMELISASVEKTGKMLVLEESAERGSVGEKISAQLALSKKTPKKIILKNTGESFAPCGEINELRKYYELDTESICDVIKKGITE